VVETRLPPLRQRSGVPFMKIIVSVAVLAILLVQASGAVPNSSVGGPLTLAVVFFSAALAVAIHEAWTAWRGVVGWIVNIVVGYAGAFVAAELGNLLMEPIFMALNIGGRSRKRAIPCSMSRSSP
jgi:uncharacterized membrane protein YeaQ/YmgE (transglycosylase-associated protein family)